MDFILSVLRKFWRFYAKTRMVCFKFLKYNTALWREQSREDTRNEIGRLIKKVVTDLTLYSASVQKLFKALRHDCEQNKIYSLI